MKPNVINICLQIEGKIYNDIPVVFVEADFGLSAVDPAQGADEEGVVPVKKGTACRPPFAARDLQEI